MNEIKKYTSFNDAYRDIAKDLLTYGHDSNGTKEINNYSFTLTDLDQNILTIAPISLSYLCGELTWYVLADESIEFISHFKSTGMNRTSETPWSNSAYGHILCKRHGFNQIQQVITALKNKPSSRRAIINLNVPDSHRHERLDEICTIALQFYIQDGKLNQTAIMRSNDAYGCLPYDLAYFTELQKMIAKEIGVEVGEYTHFAVSFHAYERDWDKLKNVENAKVDTTVSIDFDSLRYFATDLREKLKALNFDNDKVVELYKRYRVVNIK